MAFIIIALLLACIVLVSLYYVQVKRERLKVFKETFINQEIGNLLGNKIVLDQLNQKHYEQAAGLLQLSMDARVIRIWNSLGSVDSSKRKAALMTLKVIRDFQKSSLIVHNIDSTNSEEQSMHNEAIAILNKVDNDTNITVGNQ
ncbi:MAG TPA: hypothetical protein VNX46_17320 [Candidatus Acidoferrum sp.]|nr:hypothetical protein [Candidatus Acidoferrum sp.]